MYVVGLTLSRWQILAQSVSYELAVANERRCNLLWKIKDGLIYYVLTKHLPL
jgi:DNA-binding PadR family transcriptional regulator